jgi:hypothetical protein
MEVLNMKDKSKKYVAVAIAAVAGLGLGGVTGVLLQPEPQVIYNETIVEVPTLVEVPVEKIVNNTINVEVEKIVEVDNGNLALVCERLEDRMIIQDAVTCVEEVKAEDEAIKLALKEIKSELPYLIAREEGVDVRDIKIVRIYNNYDEMTVTSDFKNDDYTVELRVRVENRDTNERSDVDVKVNVYRGRADVSLI